MTRTFKSRPSTVHEQFGDETVILNLDTGSYYSAQGTGAVIWGLVRDGTSEAEILRHMAETFSGDSDVMASATTAFLGQLVSESLVEPEAASNATGSPEMQSAETPKEAFSEPLLQKYTDMEEMLLLDPIHEVDEHGWPSSRKPAA